jgi:hypothetical protein
MTNFWIGLAVGLLIGAAMSQGGPAPPLTFWAFGIALVLGLSYSVMNYIGTE